MQPNDPNSRNKLTGTGFTNIDRILKANENNRLGSTLQTGITDEANKAKTALANEQQSFQTKAQENRLGTEADKQKRANVLDRFAAPSGFQDVTEQETQDFSKFREGAYKGPLELGKEQVQRAGSKAQQAEQLGQLTQTQGGRGELLKRFAGQEGYTRGQQNLDQLLLGRQAKDQLKDARRSTLGMADIVARQQEAARGQGEQFRREAEEFGKQTRSSLADMFGSREEQLGAKTTQAYQDVKSLRDQMYDKLAREERLSPEEVSVLGLSPEQEQQLNRLMDISGQEHVTDLDVEGGRYHGGQEAFDKYRKSLKISEDTGYDEFGPFRRGYGFTPREAGSSDSVAETRWFKTYDEAEKARDKFASTAMQPLAVQGKISGDFLNKYFSDNAPVIGHGLPTELLEALDLNTGEIKGFSKSVRPDFEFERYLGDIDQNKFTKETVGSVDELMQINALRKLQGLEPLYTTDKVGTAPKGFEFLSQQALDDAAEALKLEEINNLDNIWSNSESKKTFMGDLSNALGSALNPVASLIDRLFRW